MNMYIRLFSKQKIGSCTTLTTIVIEEMTTNKSW